MAYTRVNWEDLPSTDTPINATNLNIMDKGIKDLEDSLATVATTGDYDDLSNKPTNNLVNVSNEVDEDYRVNVLHSRNLFDLSYRVYTAQASSSVSVSISNNVLTASISSGYAHNSYVIPVEIGKKYTIKWTNATGLNSVQCGNGATEVGTQYFRSYQTSDTQTITATSKTLFVNLLSSGATLTITNFQIEEGETATTYTPFIQNQIVVDDIKYTDTLNVGTTIDSRSRVNVLYSKNLFDKDNATITNAYFDSSTGALISGGGSYVTENYTEVNANTTYIVGNVTLSRVVFYNSSKGVISVATTSTSFTTPANTKYIRIQITTNTSNIIIQEGNSIITPSIYVDNEEIYSKPVVLYSSATGSNGTITLNDDVSNYKYLEIYFDGSNPTRVGMQKMDLGISNGTSLFKWNCDSGGSVYAIIRDIKVSGRTLENFTSGANYSVVSYTSSLSKQNTNNVYIYKVLGYK